MPAPRDNQPILPLGAIDEALEKLPVIGKCCVRRPVLLAAGGEQRLDDACGERAVHEVAEHCGRTVLGAFVVDVQGAPRLHRTEKRGAAPAPRRGGANGG
ncbi:MAG: hypothetical protein IPP20_11125 [Gemmatimonadetes bacterium]|nr:hypothetical protein [Gemmatimonadota bacterium]